ncbi:MAG: hypothetical protein IPH13_09270 [Planctomycetes bacterium]|nr:hypothetical protein [Planctomycetota bacterium]
MIGAALVVIALGLVDGWFTWRVDPLTPRVGDRVVLEAVLEPTPRDPVAVTEPGSVLGWIEVGEFALRRDGVRLVLTRTYVVAASGAIDLPQPLVRAGDSTWRARPVRLDVAEVEPGRRGRELVDLLTPIALDEPGSSRALLVFVTLACAVSLGLWRRRLAARRVFGEANRIDLVPSEHDAFVARLDRIASAFATRAVPLRATADELRDLLRDVLAARSGSPARARTSAELDALTRSPTAGNARFCAAILEAVEAQCYGKTASNDVDEIERWLSATRAWLTPARGAA